MKNKKVRFDLDHRGVATLTLNRPKVHNALDDELIGQFINFLKRLHRDDNARVLILRGEGSSFSSGADAKWLRHLVKFDYSTNLLDAQQLAAMMTLLNTLPIPTISMVQGPAYGGGLGLIACCDIAVCNQKARFCFSEVKLGLAPAVISPYVIQAIGERAARRYFLSAEVFGPQEALQLGLIHQTTEDDTLEATVNALTEQFLNNSPTAIRETKKLIAMVSKRDIGKDTIDATVELIARLRVSPEGQAGLNAFLNKAAPPWDASKDHN